MNTTGPTWVVLVRDVSYAVRVKNEPTLVASMVLDADTGLIRGVNIAATARAACAEAMRAALTKPVQSLPPLPPQPPVEVVCGPEYAAEVARELARLLPGAATPPVNEAVPEVEAEDILDSMVGHLSGRRQPDDPPTGEDWSLLYAHALRFCRNQPWLRWSDADTLDLFVNIDGIAARYVCVVIGQEEIQRGLVLYPGGALPDGLVNWEPDREVPVPAGTVMFHLDPPDQARPEFTAKAARYGWPPAAEFHPLFVAGEPDGAADVDRTQVHHLTVAIAAMLNHDRLLTSTGRKPGDPGKSSGKVALADGQKGGFTIIGV